MRHSPPNTKRLVRLGRAVALACALALVVPQARAQSTTEDTLPDGIPVGSWILTPSIESEIRYEDNIFRRNDDDPLGAPSDRVSSVLGALGALLPFRASRLYLGWSGNRTDYRDQQFSRDLTQDLDVDLELNFGSGERLTISDTYTRGIQDVQALDEGLELVFEGRAYDLNTWTVELERREPRRAGYTVRLQRTDLNFDGDDPVSFFDYRGLEGSAEYRHPIAGQRWLLGYASVRRFDHFEVGGEVGTPFRRENTESAQVGLTGSFRGGSPYLVRVGVGRLSYDLQESSDFNGVVGTVRARLPLGASSALDVSLRRRALPSNFISYYINNEFKVELERRWRTASRVGMRGLVAVNEYADLLVGTVCDDVLRRDTRYLVDAFAEWTIERRVALRIAGTHQGRSSNCAPAEFESNAVSAGVGIRWY